jgi:glycosyltransferase involved in cell wall biosynthesis
MKSKKIGLLIPNLQSGGAERVLSLMSNILSQAGYYVYFILYDTDDIKYEYSGKLIDLKTSAGSNVLTKVAIRLIRIIKLSYYKYKYNLDTVISFLYPANVVNYYSIGRTKKILACRGYGDYIKNGKRYSKMINKIYSFIVQTERMKSEFIKDLNNDESKVNVLYNPFDIELIKDKSKEGIEKEIQDFIDTHKTICTVGSFKRDKGYWHLIKSFIKVKQHINNAGLIFIGHRGEMEKEIKDLAKASRFNNDILFLGYQTNPFKYISKCDLYVCSSIYEGFPNSLVEAMACGTAVLSTDCKTGPREVLCSSYHEEQLKNVKLEAYGVLVPILSEAIDINIDCIDSEEIIMAEGIVKVLSNEGLLQKLSKSAKFRADEFSLERYRKSLIEIIELL